LKYGSSLLRTAADVPTVVHDIYRFVRDGHRVVAVVSALGQTTDELLEGARSVWDGPPLEGAAKASVASLLSTGEQRSVALLALGLAKAGIGATRFDDPQAWIRTTGDVLDASPIGLDRGRFERAFQTAPVIVLPGFVGLNRTDEVTVLGRGGSDLSALFVAWALSAKRCRLVKDVDGIYTEKPDTPGAQRYQELSWADADGQERPVLQTKALQFAQKHGQRFEVGTLFQSDPTRVGGLQTVVAAATAEPKRLTVGLLGLGTVGTGVLHRLNALNTHFELIAACVSDPTKHQGKPLPAGILTDSWADVIRAQPDVVVELIGGSAVPLEAITAALQAGSHVVSANKALLAKHAPTLLRCAREHGVTLRYSAAVGGVTPALERVDQLAQQTGIASFHGVINGSCNWILDRVAQGASFEEAIADAQEAGYAEADPSLDISGRDTAEKLGLLIQHAFGVVPDVDRIPCEGIDKLDETRVRAAQRSARRVRLVATCERTPLGIRARVQPEILPATHPLAQVRGTQNRLVITPNHGPEAVVDGAGAGRWPTSESVVADLLAIARTQTHSTDISLTEAEHEPLD